MELRVRRGVAEDLLVEDAHWPIFLRGDDGQWHPVRTVHDRMTSAPLDDGALARTYILTVDFFDDTPVMLFNDSDEIEVGTV